MRRKTTTRRAPAPVRTSSGSNTPKELFNGSLDELISCITQISTAMEPASREMYNNNFSGNIKNSDHSKEMLLNGCPELMEKYLNKAQSMNIKPAQDLSPVYMPANEGLFFSVPAYLEGQPEHWINLEEAPAAGSVKDLYINVAVGCSVTPDHIFNKLINIVKYVDEKESAGTRLNVYLTANCAPGSDNPNQEPVNILVKIKNDRDPVNLQQLVYLVASPIMLRFAFLILTAEHCKGFTNNGNYRSDQDAERESLKRTDIIYIPSIYYDQKNSIFNYSDIQAIYPHLNN